MDRVRRRALPFWDDVGRRWKILWIIGLLWIGLHLLGVWYTVLSGDPDLQSMGIGLDWGVYRAAAQALVSRAPVYDLSGPMMATADNFRYHPAFAGFVWLWGQVFGSDVGDLLWYVLVAGGFIAGLIVWGRVIVRVTGRPWSNLAGPLLVGLLAFDWIGNWLFGNVGPLLVLLSGLLALALIEKRVLLGGVMLAAIAILKVYWAFPLLIPLVLRDWKTLARVVAVGLACYLGVTILLVSVVGWTYGVELLRQYVAFAGSIQARYPWRGTEAAFDTLQNSLYQTILRYVGFVPWAGALTLALQVGLVGLVAVEVLRVWRSPQRDGELWGSALAVAFLGYGAAMLLLPQVEEANGGGVVFALLWIAGARRARRVSSFFILYALVEIPGLVSTLTGIRWLYIPKVVPWTLMAYAALMLGCIWLLDELLGGKIQFSGTAEVGPAPSETWAEEELPSAAVVVRHVSRVYTGTNGRPDVIANDDLSLDVTPGEIFGLLGPNGAGKTTLVSQLLGLVKPTRGRIWVEGIDVTTEPERVKSLVGFLPQQGLPMRTVEVARALRYTGCLRGQPEREAAEQATALMADLGITAFAHQYVNKLSGGVLRLVNFGMALMGHPRLLVLDEPTNELDPANRRMVWNMIGRLNRDTGVTCILVTHNVLEAEQVVHRVAVMDKGRVLAVGTPAELTARAGARVRLEFHVRDGCVLSPQELDCLRSLAVTLDARPGEGYRLYVGSDQVPVVTDMMVNQIGLHRLEDFRLIPPSLEDLFVDLGRLR